jgi:type IV pilus assembly protein PilC
MAMYSYKAMNPAGRIVLGHIDAINVVDLEMRLKRMELDFVNGELVKEGRGFVRAKIPRSELINFCFYLEQLTRAGVPIIEGLGDMRDSMENPRFREVLSSMIESISGGKTVSEAMMEHPTVFDEVFTSLIEAGEDTGQLPDVLKNLTESIKWQDELASQTQKLIMYPAFMGTVVIGVTFFMMIYLVPKMASFIRNMGQQLPLQTKVLIFVSDAFVNYWYLIIGLPIIAAIAINVSIRTNKEARRRFDGFKLSIPLVGDILRKIILSRFAGIFAMMYGSGISILDSIKATEKVVGNAVMKEALQEVGRLIADGKNVTAAFQSVGLFPPLVIRMLRVGESTGALDTALLNVSYFYNRDVKESIARVQTMIEPVMTVTVGIILGWVMLAVLGPIYDTISKLKV